MSGQRNSNIKHSKSGSTMNKIEFAIFGAIIIYIIVLVISYAKSDPVKGYEIQMGSLSVSKTYTGIAIRQEEKINASSTGYINYYVREGERVSTRDSVFVIDESNKLSAILDAGTSGENTYTDDELYDLKADIIQYDRIFAPNNFKSVYDFKYEVEGDVIKLANLSMSANLESLKNSNQGGLISLYSTGKTGYIVYSTDGFEDLKPEDITAETFDQTKYEKVRTNSNDLVEKGNVIGKIITSENWSLVIPVDTDRSKELEEAEYVKVKFIKTQTTSWAKVNILHLGDGDYAELIFNNSCVSYCTERFIDIELVVDDTVGLKIPNSAIVEKEFFIIPAEYMSKGGSSGNYGVSKEFFDENGNVIYKFVETTVYNSDENEFYVDNTSLSVGDYICKPDSGDKMAVSKSGKLIGVYNMNKGYADFKQITILSQNEEYAIVSSNTKYGLTVYDRIVLDASSVNNDEFIYK